MAETIILGISAGHDAAATVVAGGKVISHIIRERISGIRHHYGIDRKTIELALSDAGVTAAHVTAVALTGTQLMPTLIDDSDYFSIAPTADTSALTALGMNHASQPTGFRNAMRPKEPDLIRQFARKGGEPSEWADGFMEYFRDDWRIPPELHRDWLMFQHVSPVVGPAAWRVPFSLSELGGKIAQFLKRGALRATTHAAVDAVLDGRTLPGVFVNHHTCHAASSYFTSPFPNAVIITHDGGMNADSGFVFLGRGRRILPVSPHFVVAGQFYDHVAMDLDLGHMGGAGKLMGLAGFGKGQLPDALPVGNQWDWRAWADAREPGWSKSKPLFQVMIDALREKAAALGHPVDQPFDRKLIPNPAASEIAWAAQSLVERTMLETVSQVRAGLLEALPECPENLCLSGGVALNCPANTRIHDAAGFKHLSIEPHCEDSGISLGAALYLQSCLPEQPLARSRKPRTSSQAMLGQRHKVLADLQRAAAQSPGIITTPLTNWCEDAAERLAADQVIALYQGRSEAGPRALGHRSILANPSHLVNWQRVNDIKGREHWRPFAPAMLAHRLRDWFKDGPESSPFMLFTYDCLPEQRARIPAVIHFDGTSRVQTVVEDDGPLFEIITAFERLTGLPVVMNTSFNGPGEPIIETVDRAVEFLKTRNVDAMYFSLGGKAAKSKGIRATRAAGLTFPA